MDPFDVLVRGTGIVGRTLALALARQGLHVALLEAPARASSAGPDVRAYAGPDVRAYALNAASVALLSELKVWASLPADAVTPVHDMCIRGDRPGAALEFSAWQQEVGELAWIVDAQALEETLATAVRYAPHITATREAVPARLTALCEGKASAARDALGVAFHSQPYGQRAIAARLRADTPHAGVARQWFHCPDVLALLPFDRPQPQQSYALVWSLPEARAQELMACDTATFEAALAQATAGQAGLLRLAGERVAWPLMLARAERFSGPGWVLLGDCAHVVHPLAGQGLNLGLADVATLARVLAARESWRALGDEKLLRRYARERELPTAAMARTTDALLHLFAHEAPWLRELRNRGLGLVDHLPALKRWLVNRALGA